MIDTKKSVWNYFNFNQLNKNFLSPRDLALYCGLRFTLEDLV